MLAGPGGHTPASSDPFRPGRTGPCDPAGRHVQDVAGAAPGPSLSTPLVFVTRFQGVSATEVSRTEGGCAAGRARSRPPLGRHCVLRGHCPFPVLTLAVTSGHKWD